MQFPLWQKVTVLLCEGRGGKSWASLHQEMGANLPMGKQQGGASGSGVRVLCHTMSCPFPKQEDCLPLSL